MMGWRTKLQDGSEYDALTRWRQWFHFRAGVRAWIKRKHNKRERKRVREELR